MQLRKTLALVLVGVMAVVAGCSGAKDTQKPAGNDTTAPAKKDPVTIEFWHGMSYDSAHGKTLQELVKQFNESQKDVIVKETYQGSYADLEKKLVTAFNAGQAPAVVQNTDSMLTSLVDQKMVQPLEGLVPAAELSDYPDGFKKAQTIGGKLYALPFNKSMIVLFYNKKLVPTPPKNFTEFRDMAKKVTGNGVYGTAFPADVYYFGNHLVTWGGSWLNTDNTKATFNSDEGVQALQYVADMAKEGSAIQMKAKEYQSDYFNRGQAAMVATTTASLAFIKPTNGDPWGVVPLYAGPKNDLTGLSGANVAIMDKISEDQKQAGLKFMLWLTGKEGTLKWAMAKTGYMPVRKSAVATKEWQDFVAANPEYKVMSEAIDKGTTQPNIKQWANIQKEITTAVEKVLLGQATPKAALDEAAKKADELLAKK